MVGNGQVTNKELREALNQLEKEIVSNVLMTRSNFLESLIDPRRNIEKECGYPESGAAINVDLFKQLYDRNSIGARVVEVFPKESWQTQPLIYEDPDSENATEFEEAWDELGKSIKPLKSYYKQESGSPVWNYLLRADILSGIGHFGIILLGIDDGKPLHEPVDGVEEEGLESEDRVFYPPQGTDAQYDRNQVVFSRKKKKGKNGGTERKLIFLRVFDESLVQITQYEQRTDNPRFGQPVMYSVTLNDPREQHAGVGLPLNTYEVHWTRVIHVADTNENAGSSEIFAVPRQRPVLNNILGLHKLYCASPEMFWKGAFYGLSIETHPQLGGDVQVSKSEVREEVKNLFHSLQRAMVLSGMTAKTLAPTIVDPTTQIEVQIVAICIKLGIPIRVFKGSERGELASSQDDDAWNDRLKARQSNYITPEIICKFIDRLITIGVLPEPEQYYVEWPDLTSMNEGLKTDIQVKKTGAMAQYVSGGLEALITPMDYLTKIMDFTEEEAEAIVEAAAEAEEERLEEEAALQPQFDPNNPLDPNNPFAGNPNQPPNGPPPNGQQPPNIPQANPPQGKAQPPQPPNTGFGAQAQRPKV